MEQEVITTRETTYQEMMMGDLLYDDDFGTTVERTDDRIIIKVELDKYQTWLELADQLWCSVKSIEDWVWEMRKEGKEFFSELPALQQAENRVRKSDLYYPRQGYEDRLYAYFYEAMNWVMYENDNLYLLLYEMEIKDSYRLTLNHQLDALHFWPADDLADMTDFMRSWYYRANGYPEEEEEEGGR